MTVEELRNILSSYPPDMTVEFSSEGPGDGWLSIGNLSPKKKNFNPTTFIYNDGTTD